MARRLCFLWLILLSVNVWGANDSILVKGIAQASRMALRNQNDSAIALADSLIPIARKQNALVALASLYDVRAISYSNKKNYQKTVEDFTSMFNVAAEGNFINKAPNNPFLFHLMLPAYVQMAVLAKDLGSKEASVLCAKAGILWTSRCKDKELVVSTIPAFGAILTENKEYLAAYEPLKQAYDYAIQLGDTNNALGIVRSLVEAEEHIHHVSPEKNQWIKVGERLVLKTKKDPMSFAFLTTAHKSMIKELERRDSDMIKSNTGTRDTARTITPPIPQSKNDSIQHHIQYVHVRNVRIVKIGLIIIALLLLAFGVYALWQRHVRRKRETERYIEGLEQERNRLAKELHDGVSNQLLAVEMKLNEEGTKEQAIQMLNESREQVRRVSHELMPPEFAYATLDEVISHYVLELDEANHCDISCHLNPPDADWSTIPPQEALEIYRIVQEAIGNALKHSGATTIAVGMHKTGQETAITISDNGTSDEKTTTSGIGIRTMKQRAQLIGATLEFRKNKYGHVVKLNIE